MANNEAVFKIVLEDAKPTSPVNPAPPPTSSYPRPYRLADDSEPMPGNFANPAAKPISSTAKPIREIFGFLPQSVEAVGNWQSLATPAIRRESPNQEGGLTDESGDGGGRRGGWLQGLLSSIGGDFTKAMSSLANSVSSGIQNSNTFAGNDASTMFSAFLGGATGGKSVEQEAKEQQIAEMKKLWEEERNLALEKLREEREIARKKLDEERTVLLAEAKNVKQIEALGKQFQEQNQNILAEEQRKKRLVDDAYQNRVRQFEAAQAAEKREEMLARRKAAIRSGEAFWGGAARSAGSLGAAIGGSEAGVGDAVAGVVAGGAVSAVREFAGALGPAGKTLSMTIMGFEAAGRMFTAAQDQAAKNLVHFGKTASQIVTNDLLGARRAQMQKEIDEKGATPIIGAIRVWMSGLKKELAGMDAFQSLRGAAKQEGERLAPWSGAISAASAQADVTKMLADARSAKANETALAGFISANAKFEAAMQAAVVPIQKKIAEQLTEMVKGARPFDQKMFEQLEQLNSSQGIMKMIASNTAEGKKLQAEVVKELKRLNEKEDEFTGPAIFRDLQEGVKLLPNQQAANWRGAEVGAWGQQQMIKPIGR